MESADIPYLSVAELSELIRRREVSPVEATEAYLGRIDDLDFKFNAYLTVCRKQALEAAHEAEQAIARGDYLGPLHGIPVAAKDQLWSRGIRSTAGSRILVDFVPDEDATAIANLKRAGAILLGKTNLTEFAIGGPHRYSIPRNPWDLDRETGRSSSGSGAATAGFLCATSLGEDTGGSIRWPGSWCGIVGLRPSWGRVSRYGLMPGVWSQDAVGPISRTVEDAAITLGAIAGHDPKDRHSWDAPVPDYRSVLDGNIGGIRVGLVVEQTNIELVQPEVRDAVVKATGVLAELGATVEEVSIPLAAHATVIHTVMVAVEPASVHRDRIKNRLRDLGHSNRIGLLMGSLLPAQYYYKAQKLRAMLRRQVLEALERYDVLVQPTTGNTAPMIESPPVTPNAHPASRMPYLLTRIFNLASAPAISVPCGISSEGMPIGLQIGGRPGDDETVLKVAHAYEQSTPWHKMRPPNA